MMNSKELSLLRAENARRGAETRRKNGTNRGGRPKGSRNAEHVIPGVSVWMDPADRVALQAYAQNAGVTMREASHRAVENLISTTKVVGSAMTLIRAVMLSTAAWSNNEIAAKWIRANPRVYAEAAGLVAADDRDWEEFSVRAESKNGPVVGLVHRHTVGEQNVAATWRLRFDAVLTVSNTLPRWATLEVPYTETLEHLLDYSLEGAK